MGLLFACIAALTIGCQRNAELGATSRTSLTSGQVPAQANPVSATPVQAAPVQLAQPAEPRSMPMFAAPGGEQQLDTQVAPSTAPVLTTQNLKTSKVRTVSDDRLPKWVPKKGRLTVVDSSDLAENLGLVPKGTSKNSDERISVADKLAEESAARAAKGDTMQQGTSWSYARAGKFRSRR